jgi:hypothetical protein
MASGFFNATGAIQRLSRMSKGLKFECDKVASKTLSAARAEIKRATPVRFTGETRRAWVVERRAMSSYRTYNKTNAAWFLEHGTEDHGPTEKKKLFIPLNKRAFFVYRANTFPPLTPSVPKLGIRGDYILVPHVKGIKPHKMAGRNVRFAVSLGVSSLTKMIQSL